MKANGIARQDKERSAEPLVGTNENIGLNLFFKTKIKINYLINLKTKGKELCIY
tara:strand:- start:1014 stop:1175 length:162 start_codon:yes stop_codon:yes gene_type:complete